MLETYQDKQPLFCENVYHSIHNHKVSHAYLIETNQYQDKDDIILSFIKTLFCECNSSDSKTCSDDNICNLIDHDSFPDLMIIKPDGAWIKKDQILEIKERFKTTSFQNRPRIYWIQMADKMNKQAANSLLKFLEEPEGNVIAILETDNRYKVLETIRSRCQTYSFINKEYRREFENFSLLEEIIKTLEEKKKHSIAYFPVLLENDYRNKDFWNMIFNDMIHLYENAIRKFQTLNFYDYGKVLDIIIDSNSLSSMIYKIKILFQNIERLDYNLNMAMMLDQFIIEFSGGD